MKHALSFHPSYHIIQFVFLLSICFAPRMAAYEQHYITAWSPPRSTPSNLCVPACYAAYAAHAPSPASIYPAQQYERLHNLRSVHHAGHATSSHDHYASDAYPALDTSPIVVTPPTASPSPNFTSYVVPGLDKTAGVINILMTGIAHAIVGYIARKADTHAALIKTCDRLHQACTTTSHPVFPSFNTAPAQPAVSHEEERRGTTDLPGESYDTPVTLITSYNDLPPAEAAHLRAYDDACQHYELLTLATHTADRLVLMTAYATKEQRRLERMPAHRRSRERLHKRLDALEETRAFPQDIKQVSTPLAAKTRKILERLHETYELFQTCTGTTIQRVLHSEYVTIIEQSAKQLARPESADNIRDPLFISLIRCAKAGRQASEHHLLRKSFDIADACWATLECVGGVADGVTEGAANVAHRINYGIHQPGDAAHSLIHGALSLGGLVCEGAAAATQAIARAAITADSHYIVEDIYEPVAGFCECILERIVTTSLPELTRQTTRFFTEVYLDQKILCAVAPTLKRAAQVALKAEEARGGLAVAAGATTQAGPKIPLLGTGLTIIEEMTELTQPIALQLPLGCSGVAEALAGVPASACAPCLHTLSQRFPTTFACLLEQFNNVHKGITMGKNALRHVFFPDMNRSAKFLAPGTGWHSGMAEVLEGIEKFIHWEGELHEMEVHLEKLCKEGFSIREWRILGVTDWKTSSFFPLEWAPEHVGVKTLEALKNVNPKDIAAALDSDLAAYNLVGSTNEGYAIGFRIEKGVITSFYPDIGWMLSTPK